MLSSPIGSLEQAGSCAAVRPDRFLYVRSYYGKLAAPARGWSSGTVAWDGRQKASAQPSPGRAKDN